VTDPKKIAEIHALTRPSAQARDGAPVPQEEWDDRSLPAGSRVGEFEVTSIIGKGGFGIVYLAWDHSLERVVALKEYMPASFASRSNRTQVHPLSERHRETFQVGLNSFVNEARLLAQFHSPSLVEVHRFWEANGTAYMVMPYYRGVTLGETVRAFAGPPDQAWLMDLLAPLTEALMDLHSVQCYHRDIAPDNILILADSGAPLLLDFGAARRVIAGQAHALTIILKAGYAPIEQYGEIPGMQQGPWTDVYALASVVYWAVTGTTPPAATSRMIRDTYVPLADCAPPQYSRAFASAVDRALAVLPEARTASIDALRGELGLGTPTGRGAAPAFRWSDPDATVLAVGRTAPPAPPPREPTRPDSRSAPTAAAPPPARPRNFPMAAGLGTAALLAAVAAGIWVWRSGDAPAPPPAAAPKRSDIAPPAAAPALPRPAPAPSIPVPQSAADAFALILASTDPALRPELASGGRKLQAGRARSVSYTVNEPGYLYLIGLHAGKDAPLALLLPQPGAAPARIDRRGKLDLPLSALTPGRWKFAFMVARQPLDPAAFGWIAEDGAWSRRFGENLAPGMRALLPWDIPACAPGALPCKAAYGAAAFELDIEPAPTREPARQAPPQAAQPVRKAERSAPPSAKPAANPECEKILTRLSLGETGQDLIDRMKSLKCN
jgi:serine/threonine protein kinase